MIRQNIEFSLGLSFESISLRLFHLIDSLILFHKKLREINEKLR